MKSNFVEITDQKVQYLEGGSGKTIILLPSLWLTSTSYKRIGEKLSEKFHVIIPDFYKGKSLFGKPTQSFDNYCVALNEFFDRKKIYRPILIGISYSGFISSYFASKFPDKLSQLLLFSTSAMPIPVLFPLALLIKGYIKMVILNMFSLRGIILNILFFYDGFTYFLRHPRQLFLEPKLGFDFQKLTKTTHFKIPVKLFFAKDDEFEDVITVIEANKDINNIEIEMVQGRHMWFFSNPDVFLELITKNI